MTLHILRSPSICLGLALSCWYPLTAWQAQNKPVKPAVADKSKPTPKPPADAQTGTDKPALAADKAVSIAFGSPDALEGDYIPCKFTLGQLRALVAPEMASTLTAADSERLKEKVIAAAAAGGSDVELKGSPLYAFTAAIAGENFQGLTPGEALNRILANLANRLPAPRKALPEDVAHVVDTIKSSPALKANASADTAKQVDSVTDALATKLNTAVNQPASTVQTSDLFQLAQKSLQEFLKDKPFTDLVTKAQGNDPSTATTAQKAIDATQEVVTVTKSLADQERLSTAELPKAGSIIDTARKSVATFERPIDVGCSMSILSWKETSQAFGHLIANQFIAVEVVVRNLNRDQQFVLHDVEFEVNSDPTGRLGRFFSGRDKVIVRALSSAQSSFDPRNITVHSAQGIGLIMSAAAPIFLPGEALVNAAGVYNSAFVVGLDRFWKDLSTDQLNLLNDIGFSSTKNSQSVVPQSGTVMFVTFIPVKPLEEGWWTQPCVEVQYLGSTDSQGQIVNLSHGAEPESEIADPSNTNSSHGAQIGIDASRALETCLFNDPPERSKRHWYTLGLHETQDGGIFTQSQQTPTASPGEPNSGDSSGKQTASKGDRLKANEDFFRNVYRIPYKRWSPRSMAIFEQLSNTVVAGTHIIEDQQLLASVSELKCPKDSSGSLVIDTSSYSIVCPITGKNLNQLAKLRLRNSAAQTDTATAEGPVQVVGDSSNATVSFPVDGLLALNQPVYDVFGVTLNGVEQKTPGTIHLSLSPIITGLDPSVLNSSSQTLNISGYHLGTVTSVRLTGADDATKGLTVTWDVLSSGSSDPNLRTISVKLTNGATGNSTAKLKDGRYTIAGLNSSQTKIADSAKPLTYKAAP